MKRTKPYYQQLLLGMLIVCLLSSVLSSVVAFYTFSRKIIESTSADNSKNLSIINIEFTSLFDICETVPLEHKAFADVAELCQLHFTENYTTVCTFYDDLQQLWADVDIIFIASETQDYFLGDFGTSSTFYYKIGAGIDESVAAPFLEYNASINRFIATWADGNQYIFTQTQCIIVIMSWLGASPVE